MKQLFYSGCVSAYRDIEEPIRVAASGHLSHVTVYSISDDVSVLMLTPCVPHMQTETTSAPMLSPKPEAWQS